MASAPPTTGLAPALRRFGGGGALVGGLLACVGAVVVAVWAVPHPMAPWALTVADQALGAGRPGRAVAAYEAITVHHPSIAVRNEAHRRAALVYSSQLGRPTEARRHLEEVLATTGAPVARVALLEQLGELLLDEGQSVGAAARFEAAAKALPGHPLAGQRLLRAAQVLADHRRDRQAVALYRRVERDYPVFGGASLVGRAQLRLRRGQVERALTLFERTIDRTYDPDLLEVAKLGRTVCLERLGDLDSALAELEGVDLLPESIRDDWVDALERRRPRGADELEPEGEEHHEPAVEPAVEPTVERATQSTPSPEAIEVRVGAPAQEVELKTESGATIQIRVE